MQEPTTAGRPIGVTILAVLAAIAGVLGLLGSLAFFGLLASASGLFMMIGLLTLVMSVLYLVLAYGLWTLQPWAWMLGIGLSAVSIVLTLLGLVQGTQEMIGAIISIVISAAIIYYLLTPQVKAAFGRS